MQTPSPALSGDTCNSEQQWMHVHEDGWLNAVKERMDTERWDTAHCTSLDKTAVHCPLKIKTFPFGTLGNRVPELGTGASLSTTPIREYKNEGGNTVIFAGSSVQLVQGEIDSEMRQL